MTLRASRAPDLQTGVPVYGLLSLVPPLLAIALALRTRQVHVSLFAGIWVGTTILAGFNPVMGAAGAIEQVVEVMTDAGNARTLLFTLVVGSLIVLVRESGGVTGFAESMVQRGWVRGPRSAQLISMALGVSIFIESNITCLITGTVSRPLYDRVGLSRAKLAYVCDSTSAPICMLIPLNAWGALILGLLAAEGIEDPVGTLVASIPLNFYGFLALGTVAALAITGRDYGPMRVSEERARAGIAAQAAVTLDAEDNSPIAGRKARNLIVPVVVTVAVVPWVLHLTGDGDWTRGSGSTAVLWAVSAGVVAAMLLYRAQGLFNVVELAEKAVQGMQELLPVAGILALAIGIGAVCRALGTGPFVAESVAPWIGVSTVAPLIFLTGCVIAFSTGSSWGTFAILMPIAVPLALELGAPVPLAVAAVMGGGIFGDHCSPISDTTVVSSMSAGCDHIEHVTTQLPYALAAGIVTTVLYLLVGIAL
jgi:Na+/H+ antiporter NhaC